MTGKINARTVYKTFGILLALIAANLLFTFISSPKAFAQYTYNPDPSGQDGVSLTAPSNNSGTRSPGGTITPYLVIGNNAGQYNHTQTVTRLYVDNTITGGSISFVIENGRPACNNFTGPGVVGPDYSESGGPVAVKYTVFGAGGNVYYSSQIFTSGCGDIPVTVNVNNAANLSLPTNHFDRYFEVVAKVVAGGGLGENSYRIRVVNASGVVAGFIGGDNQFAGYGFRDGDLSNGNLWSAHIEFGTVMDCTDVGNPSNKPGSVGFWDSDPPNSNFPNDPGNGWNPNIQISLQRQKVLDQGPVATVSGGWQNVQVFDTGDLTALALNQPNHQGDGVFNMRNFDSSYRYRIVLTRVGVRNTIGIQLGGSLRPIYGSLSERPSSTSKGCKAGTSPGTPPPPPPSPGPGPSPSPSPTPTPSFASCTTDPADSTPDPNQGTTITVILKNSSPLGGPVFNTKYTMRQIAPTSQIQNLRSPLAPADPDFTQSFVFTITGRPAGSTVEFQYALFDEDGDPVDSVPLCKTTIEWNNPSNPRPQLIARQCRTVEVRNVTNNAKYTIVREEHITLPNGGHRTNTIITHPSFPYVDYRILFRYANGQEAEHQDFRGNKPTNRIWDTFNGTAVSGQPGFDFQLYPHNAYSVELYVIRDGFDYGPLPGDNPNNAPIAPQGGLDLVASKPINNMQPCMDAACGNASTTVDAEPGQVKSLFYVINITNRTDRNWSVNDPSHYHIEVGTEPGLVVVSGITPDPDTVQHNNLLGGDGENVTVNFQARIDYQGDFWITYKFGNTNILLPGMISNPCPHKEITPKTRPYFEVRGDDISTGGGFWTSKTGIRDCTNYFSPRTTGDTNSGGISAYSVLNTRGSLVEFGGYPLGVIYDRATAAKPIGFYSFYKDMFAGGPNFSSPSDLGGYFNPSGISLSHCVSDYFDDTRDPLNAPSGFGGRNNFNGLANNQYLHTGDLTLNASVISPGQQLTLYVDGDVTINGNITYANSWNPTVPSNVPYLALIVRGNITLTANVDRLDGLYVAQPAGRGKGIFSTCDDFCPKQLVVNGSVIAQRVSLLRAHGTMGLLQGDVNNLCSGKGLDKCPPAEIFNYAPSMLIGQPRFYPNYKSVEGQYNLPPVF